MRANENRLTRLVDQLARLVARKPATTNRPRLRNEAVPTAPGDGAAFSALRGLLALPVRGELGSRFGGQRADGGVTWKGLFIAAKGGDKDFQAVALTDEAMDKMAASMGCPVESISFDPYPG